MANIDFSNATIKIDGGYDIMRALRSAFPQNDGAAIITYPPASGSSNGQATLVSRSTSINNGVVETTYNFTVYMSDYAGHANAFRLGGDGSSLIIANISYSGGDTGAFSIKMQLPYYTS